MIKFKSLATISLFLFLINCSNSSSDTPPDTSATSVKISNENTYYKIVIDLKNSTHRKIGEDYGKEMLKIIPDFEIIGDSYLKDILVSITYTQAIERINDIKEQIPEEYREELDGLCSIVATTNINKAGDNKLSSTEIYILNLLTDIARTTECSAISAFGDMSATGSTITGRILDWNGGTDNQLGKMQAVTIIKNGDKSICLIGYLGLFSNLTGFNSDGIFAAILDSKTGESYFSLNKRSYVFDLRYALENNNSLNDIATYMTDAQKEYTYGHLIFLSDSTQSVVVENDLSNTGSRRVRYFDSTLNATVPAWPSPALDNSIATVNSFLLQNNLDNYDGKTYNTARWTSIINQFNNYSPGKITVDELKSIISFDNDDGPGQQSDGDLYNGNTQQIIIFQPDTLSLEVYFRPKNGILDDDPVFENIPVSFD